MGSANRGTAIAPLSTIGTRYGNSVSTASMPPKPTSELSLKWLTTAENQGEKPIRNFSIDPASSIRPSIADPVFADPVSETPIPCFVSGDFNRCNLKIQITAIRFCSETDCELKTELTRQKESETLAKLIKGIATSMRTIRSNHSLTVELWENPCEPRCQDPRSATWSAKLVNWNYSVQNWSLAMP